MATVQIRTRARGFLVNAYTGEEITGADVDAQWEENVNTITSGSYDIDFSAYDNQDINMVDNRLRIKAEVYARSLPSGYSFSKWELVATNRHGDTNTYSSSSNPSHANGSSNGWALEDFIGDSTTAGRRATLDFYLYLTKGVTLSYDANGGVGAPEPTTGDEGMFSISEDVPSRSGYYFLGWAIDPSATEAQYSPGQDIEVNDSMTLYAVWSEEPGPGPGPGPSPTPHSGYLTRNKTSGMLQFAPSGHLAYD